MLSFSALSHSHGGWWDAAFGLAVTLPPVLHHGSHTLLPPLLSCHAVQQYAHRYKGKQDNERVEIC